MIKFTPGFWAANLTPLALLYILLCMTSVTVFGQTGSPLAPPFPGPRIGVQAGITENEQQGQFETDCGCAYPKGSGTGITIAALGERFIGKKWSLVGMFSISMKNTTSTNDSLSPIQKNFVKQNNAVDSGPVALTEQAKTQLTYISIVPMMRYYIASGLFLEAGPSIGFALSSNLLAQETVNTSGYTFLDGSTTRTIQNKAIPNISSFDVSLYGSLGYAFQLSKLLYFTPGVAVDFPLTSVQSGTNWKIMSFQITGAITWALHL